MWQDWITPEDITVMVPDVTPEKAAALLADVVALAGLTAPCILRPEFTATAAAKAVIRGAVVRRASILSGAVRTQTSGRHSVTEDNRATGSDRDVFTDAELESLAALCEQPASGKVRMGWLL